MRRLTDALARRRWPLFVLALVGAVLPLVVVAPNGQASRWAIAFFAVTMLLFLVLLGLNLAGRDPDADARALELEPDPVAAALLSRWLRRSKHFRFVGGLVGAILGISFIDGNVIPVLLSMLAGIAVGGALAEVHSLRRARTRPRSADIAVRRRGDYVSRTDMVALITIAVAACFLSVVALIADDHRSMLVTCLGALVCVAAVAAMQQMVIERARPALSPDLRRADDLMRRLAATQGFTRPAIALAVALLAQAVSTFGTGAANTIVVLVLWTLALAWYVLSRQSRANLLAARP